MVLKAPAKVNLFLKVVGKRADGFHDIITLIDKVSISDTIDVRLEGGDVIVECDRLEDTLVRKAISELSAEIGKDIGVKVTIRKGIPEGSGLGGGSSDASCVLKFLGEVLKVDVNEVAERVGSDVPSFLIESPCLAWGRGEKVYPVKIVVPLHYVIVVYPKKLSSKEVYEEFDRLFPNYRFPQATCPLLSDYNDINLFGENDLETAVFSIIPELEGVKKKLYEISEKAWVTGSGSAVVALFTEFGKAEEGFWKAKSMFPGCEIFQACSIFSVREG